MRVLLIGGTRFIGPRVVQRLVHNGHEVAVFYRGVHEVELPGSVRRFKDPRAQVPVTVIPEELRRFAPDVVLHMIAMGAHDAEVARKAFVNVAQRAVVLSSGDVYRAYGVFKRIEDGPLEPLPLREGAPLRKSLYPYRKKNTPTSALEYYYDKVLVEETMAADTRLPVTILRLPKVYGPEDNADLWSVYNFQAHGHWRWTHGFVENVAQAIVLSVEATRNAGCIYNVGEESTPTMSERLRQLPDHPDARSSQHADESDNFAQDIVYDTEAIRRELGYREGVPELEAMHQLATRYKC